MYKVTPLLETVFIFFGPKKFPFRSRQDSNLRSQRESDF